MAFFKSYISPSQRYGQMLAVIASKANNSRNDDFNWVLYDLFLSKYNPAIDKTIDMVEFAFPNKNSIPVIAFNPDNLMGEESANVNPQQPIKHKSNDSEELQTYLSYVPVFELYHLIQTVTHYTLLHHEMVGQYPNKLAFNWACDLVAHQCMSLYEYQSFGVRNESSRESLILKIAPNAITLGQLRKFGIDLLPNKSVVDYYAELLKYLPSEQQQQQQQQQSGGDDNDDDNDNDGDDDGDNAGGEESGQSNEKKGSQTPPKSLEDLIQNSTANKDHEHWEKIMQQSKDNNISQVIKDIVHQVIKEAAAKMQGRGIIPSHYKELFDYMEDSTIQHVNWKSYLNLFTQKLNSTDKVQTYYRQSMITKDFPGIKTTRKSNILVAIDTSGSVSLSDLNEFFNYILKIKKHAEVWIVEIDAAVAKEPYKLKNQPPPTISGRGGTDFEPVYDIYDKKKYDGIVYFTDGYCSPPQNKIASRINTIWVVSSNGRDVREMKDFPGRVIQIIKH